MILDPATVEGKTIAKFIGNFNIYERNTDTRTCFPPVLCRSSLW